MTWKNNECIKYIISFLPSPHSNYILIRSGLMKHNNDRQRGQYSVQNSTEMLHKIINSIKIMTCGIPDTQLHLYILYLWVTELMNNHCILYIRVWQASSQYLYGMFSEQPHKKSIFDSASWTLLKTKNNGTSLFSVGDNWYSWSSIIQRGLI